MGTAAYSGALNTSTGVFAIGRTGNASSDYFRGSIDEVAVYPTALSATQVANHYAIGSARAATPPSAAFAANPTSGDAPLTVAFSDLSTGEPDAWAWDGTANCVTTPPPTSAQPAAATHHAQPRTGLHRTGSHEATS